MTPVQRFTRSSVDETPRRARATCRCTRTTIARTRTTPDFHEPPPAYANNAALATHNSWLCLNSDQLSATDARSSVTPVRPNSRPQAGNETCAFSSFPYRLLHHRRISAPNAARLSLLRYKVSVRPVDGYDSQAIAHDGDRQARARGAGSHIGLTVKIARTAVVRARQQPLLWELHRRWY